MIYKAKVIEKINNGKGYWNYERIGIYKGFRRIGEYKRNYSHLYKTFFPFERNGKWYALYSKDYTASRLMELPSCKDLGGEESKGNGFCPVEFYVPKVDRLKPTGKEGPDKVAYKIEREFAPFGFIAGCVWGDDSSWKIRYVDLRGVEEGILKPDDRLGYIQLPREMSLKDAIERVYDHDEEIIGESKESRDFHQYQFTVAVGITFRLDRDNKTIVYGKKSIGGDEDGD